MHEDRFSFRAWDIKLKKMAYNVQNEYDTTSDTIYSDGTTPSTSSFCEFLEDDKRWIVMQATGLRDKNGKLIFEDDIILVDYQPVYNFKHTGVVTWDNKGFWRFAHRSSTYPLGDFNPKGKGFIYEWCEIIGDIHTTPDLKDGKE